MLVIFCLVANISSAELPHIEVDHRLSCEHIYTSPDDCKVTLTLTGAGDPIRYPIEAVLSLDSSGSMKNNNRINKSRDAATKFVSLMDSSQDKVAVINWNETIVASEPLTNDFSQIITKINEGDVGGNTNVLLGLNASISMFNNYNNNAKKVIIFLSDGNDTSPDKNLVDTIRYVADRAKQKDVIILGLTQLV